MLPGAVRNAESRRQMRLETTYEVKSSPPRHAASISCPRTVMSARSSRKGTMPVGARLLITGMTFTGFNTMTSILLFAGTVMFYPVFKGYRLFVPAVTIPRSPVVIFELVVPEIAIRVVKRIKAKPN